MGDIYRQHDAGYIVDSDEYFQHVNRLTAENLRSKSEIAQELAARDKRIAELQAELAEAREDWAREFAKRGTEVASVERQKAKLAIALMRLRDEGDQLCMTQIRDIARNALAGGEVGDE